MRSLVPMDRAIAAVEEAFRHGGHETPPRERIQIGGADLLIMPSWNERFAGVKLVTVNPENPQRGVPLINGSYVLFDRDTLQAVAMMEAAELNGIRTAAVSGVATRALAAADAQRVVIFGSGVQAHSHLDAMIAVRDIADLVVVARSEERALPLVERAEKAGLSARLGDPAAVSDADIVCTCTSSSEPVFDGSQLDAGAHVNAVGSYLPEARELDTETVRRAALVCVETLGSMAEAGDLATPLEDGVLDPEAVVDLRSVLDRNKPSEPEITLFKSVGRAFEDLAVAEVALAALD